MLCSEICPKGLTCEPLSNIVSDDKTSFVCVGLHNNIRKEQPQDIYRHCFKNQETDSMYDYDDYDLKSVISVMSEAILIKDLKDN